MTIRNATLNGDSASATSTVSFVLAGEMEKYDNSILNGKDETLKGFRNRKSNNRLYNQCISNSSSYE